MVITGSDIIRVRQALGESQTVFARRLGVDQGTISKWERTGPPKYGTAPMALRMALEAHLADRGENT